MATCKKCKNEDSVVYEGLASEVMKSVHLCEDCQKEVDKEHEARKEPTVEEKRGWYLEKGNNEEWEEFAYNSGVGKRHATCTIDNFSGNSGDAIDWGKSASSENLLIQSTKSGNGKTHLAVGAMKEWHKAKVHSVEKSVHASCLFYTFSEMMADAKDTFGKTSDITEQLLRDYLIKKPLLVIDDIGAEKVTEYTQNFLYVVLNARYEEMRPTIITTNLSPKEIVESYGSRILSRIASGVVVTVDGADNRISKTNVRKVTNTGKKYKRGARKPTTITGNTGIFA